MNDDLASALADPRAARTAYDEARRGAWFSAPDGVSPQLIAAQAKVNSYASGERAIVLSEFPLFRESKRAVQGTTHLWVVP